MKLGLISDTHGFFDPTLPRIFKGVDHILHAGDIGDLAVLHHLERIAPVTAVLGNNDFYAGIRETEVLELADLCIWVRHIVSPGGLGAGAFSGPRPDVVVFGHTHAPMDEMLGGVLYVNPGYGGAPRGRSSRSVAILECKGRQVVSRFLPLPD